jgi:hypothetical protein
MPLKNVFGRKTPVVLSMTELDSEQVRLNIALVYIGKCGNLDTYPGKASERRALMITATRRGLVAWDRRRKRYELTRPGEARFAVPISNAVSLDESGTASDDRPAATARLGQHSPAAGAERRRRAKITPIAAVIMMAACGGITAGAYLGLAEVKVPVNSPVAADVLPESASAPRGDTTATAPAAISVGQLGEATRPGSTTNPAVVAADTNPSESTAIGSVPPTSTDGGPSRQPRSSRAEGAAPSAPLSQATDEAGSRHEAKQKHHRQYYARHNSRYQSRFASQGLQGNTPAGWYWQPQF